jgi:hypothetical protein
MAREAYLLLVPAILDDGLKTVCQPLIDFLTVDIMEPAATSLDTLTVKSCMGCVHFFPIPAVISSRRSEVLYRDLTGLKESPGGWGPLPAGRGSSCRRLGSGGVGRPQRLPRPMNCIGPAKGSS